MAEELMLPKVSYRDRAETLFKVSGVKLSSMSKKDPTRVRMVSTRD
jgi:hypothetical protein